MRRGKAKLVYESKISVNGILTAMLFYILGMSLYINGYQSGAFVLIMLGVLATTLGLLPLFPVSNRGVLLLFVVLMIITMLAMIQPVVNSAMADFVGWLQGIILRGVTP
jgi:hypothetical protein